MKRLRVTVEGKTYEVEVELLEDDESEGYFPTSAVVSNAAPAAAAQIAPQVKKKAPAAASVAGGDNVVAPMAGNITAVTVKVGDDVNQGDKVAEMEAMKMLTPLKATKSGKVTEIKVAVGDNVDQGAIIVVIG